MSKRKLKLPNWREWDAKIVTAVATIIIILTFVIADAIHHMQIQMQINNMLKQQYQLQKDAGRTTLTEEEFIEKIKSNDPLD